MRSLCAISLMIFAVALNTFDAFGTEKKIIPKSDLEWIIIHLKRQGLKESHLNRIFYRRPIKLITESVRLNVLNPDTKALYESFLTQYSIRNARRFLDRHRGMLHRVQRTYQVKKETIVAILFIETRFGKAHLPFQALDVLTTMALADTKDYITYYQDIFRSTHVRLNDREYVSKRLKQKADFGRTELLALLKIYRNYPERISHVRGSYAGAIGIPQFLPSSYIKWGADGNQDRRIDLDNIIDAAASVGNFLKKHGWKKNQFETQRKAVWFYNKSPHYVHAVIEIGIRLSRPLSKSVYRGRLKN